MLNKYHEIAQIVLKHIDDCLSYTMEEEFQLTMVCMVGSRIKGNFREDSDLDIAISYRGTFREDSLFNELNAKPLLYKGIMVDFIPFGEEKGNAINLEEPHLVLFSEEEITEPLEYDEDKMKRLVKKDGLL